MKNWIKLPLVAACLGTGAHALAQSPLTVNILHVNDHHSHLEAENLRVDTSALGLATTRLDGSLIDEAQVNYGGYPMLASSIDRIASLIANPLKIHAGDAITGTLYYTLYAGEADAALMNEVCFDVFALGNHEFDAGDSGLAQFLDYLNSTDCVTPALAANVVPGPDSPLSQGDYLQPYSIKEFDGQRVGVIGLDIAQKTKESSRPDNGTEFLDEAATAQRYIDELTNMGVNKIILVTHYQYHQDIQLARRLTGVDVIVGGDSHTLLGGENLENLGLPVSGEYPTMELDQNGNPVCIVQAWEYAHLYGRLRVVFDRDGQVALCKGNPIVPIGRDVVFEDSDGEEVLLRGDDRKAVLSSLVSKPEFMYTPRPDAEATAKLAAFASELEVLKQQDIGEVSQDLCLERWPGQGLSSLCDSSATYLNGSDISNVVAKAFMEGALTADFAIQNGGGVRVDLPAGRFTIADAYTLLPFANTLVVLEMTGQQIIDVLEDALSNTLDKAGSSGSYPYASGIRFDVDASADFGARISGIEVNSRLQGEWTAIDPGATYRVATNDFIASGQDGYDTFGKIFDAGAYEDTFIEYAQGFVDYVTQLSAAGKTVDKLPAGEYSTRSYIGSDGCDHATDDSCEGY